MKPFNKTAATKQIELGLKRHSLEFLQRAKVAMLTTNCRTMKMKKWPMSLLQLIDALSDLFTPKSRVLCSSPTSPPTLIMCGQSAARKISISALALVKVLGNIFLANLNNWTWTIKRFGE